MDVSFQYFSRDDLQLVDNVYNEGVGDEIIWVGKFSIFSNLNGIQFAFPRELQYWPLFCISLSELTTQ